MSVKRRDLVKYLEKNGFYMLREAHATDRVFKLLLRMPSGSPLTLLLGILKIRNKVIFSLI